MASTRLEQASACSRCQVHFWLENKGKVAMATQQQGTAVGVFQNHEDARKAIRALKDAGFTDDQIGVASSNREALRSTDEDDAEGNYAGEGAAAGLATGAGLGALWGLGILAGVLPAIGPAIAG